MIGGKAGLTSEGVAGILAPDDAQHSSEIIQEVQAIYRVRHDLAHVGRAELGDAPRKLQAILKDVLIAKLGVQKVDDADQQGTWTYTT